MVKLNRFLRVLGGSLAILPILTLCLLYTLVLYAKITFGFWPLLGNPDPVQEPLKLFSILTGISLLVSILSPLGISVLWLVAFLEDERSYKLELYAPTKILFFTYAMLWVVLISDPGNYFSWFFD